MLGGVGLALLLLLVGSAGAAYAQVEGSNSYRVPSAGFEIQIPSGWAGRLVDDEFAIVYPDGPESDAAITVLVADRPNTKNLMTSKIGIELDKVVIREDESCASPLNEIIQLAGTRVFHTIQECAEGQYSKTSTYVIFTLTDSVAVSLSATSPEAYDRHLAAFEESLRTITVDSPIDFRTGLEIILGTTTLYTKNIAVGSASSDVRFTAGSTSRIRDVEFDEESKRISIVVDEIRRSEGHLLVPAHRLLAGPYQVYLNGEPHDDFIVIQAEGNTSQLVDIEYDRGVHTIDIVGTAVVPEFNGGVALVLAVVISSAILLARKSRLVLC